MTPDAIAADSSLLSMDQAVAELAAEIDKDDKAPAAAETPEGTNTEADPAAEDASEPEAVTDGEDAETEDAEAAEEAKLPAIEPPRFWDAEAKARFGDLPRDLQELVLAKETERDRATAQKIEQTALKSKALDTEASRLAQLTGHLDKLIPQAEQTFATTWGIGEIDWNRVAQEQGIEQAFRLKNDHDSQFLALQQLKAAKEVSENVSIAKFKDTRAEEMKTVVPELADAKNGAQRQLELVQYLATEGGVDPNVVINTATAKFLSIGWKSYLYDKLHADAKAKAASPPTPAKTATPGKPSVKPTAAPGRSGSPQHARLQQLARKSNLSMDEAVEQMALEESLK